MWWKYEWFLCSDAGRHFVRDQPEVAQALRANAPAFEKMIHESIDKSIRRGGCLPNPSDAKLAREWTLPDGAVLMRLVSIDGATGEVVIRLPLTSPEVIFKYGLMSWADVLQPLRRGKKVAGNPIISKQWGSRFDPSRFASACSSRRPNTTPVAQTMKPVAHRKRIRGKYRRSLFTISR